MNTAAITVSDVVAAIGWMQPTWVDGGHTHEQGTAIADAFRRRINGGESMPDHHVHALWLLEQALEWATHDCFSDCTEHDRTARPPAYVAPDECQWCKPTPPRPRRYDQCDETCTTDCGHCKGQGKPAQLWDRATVDRLKATSLVIAGGDAVVFEKNASPANALQAGIELGFPHFSHLWGAYVVHSKTERNR